MPESTIEHVAGTGSQVAVGCMRTLSLAFLPETSFLHLPSLRTRRYTAASRLPVYLSTSRSLHSSREAHHEQAGEGEDQQNTVTTTRRGLAMLHQC
jgi:hypothetical protein